MIQSIAGKRDIGQCEVSRLLFSGRLYHSSFEYVVQTTNLGTRQVDLSQLNNGASQATQKSMIDFFKNRKLNPMLEKYLNKITNLIEFARMFKVVKKSLIENKK